MFSPGQMRHGWALLSATATFAVCVAVAVPTVQAEKGLSAPLAEEPGAPPPRRSAEPAAADHAAEELARQARIRQSLNIYLVRDREYSVLLETAAELIRAGRTATAIRQLQELLDAPQDVFVWGDAESGPQSAQAAAIEVLHGLPAGGRDEYERLYGPDADRLLQEFRSTADLTALSRLLQRYRLTQSGADALELCAQSAMDHARFVEAAGYWRLWFEDRRPAAADCRLQRLQAEVAARLAAADGAEILLPPFDGGQPVVIAGVTRSAEDWVREFVEAAMGLRAAASPEFASHTSPAGRRVGFPAGAVPTASPLWSSSFANELEATSASETLLVAHREESLSAAEVLPRWEAARTAQRVPCAGANVAVVHDGCLLVKDYSSVTARDVLTGELLWQFPLEGAIDEVLGRIPASASTTDPYATAVQLFDDEFVANSVLGTLTCDSRHVYLIDALPPGAESGADHPAADLLANRLVALHLRDDGAGTLAWEFPPASRSRADHRGWFLLGPPTPAREALFVMEERDDEIHLLALDAVTGALRWDQPVSLVDRSIDECARRRRIACSPVVADGIVLCPTQLGTLAAVDALCGRLLWAYSYSDFSGPSQPWRGARTNETTYGRPDFANQPLVARGRVISMTPQTADVHCIDLLTGRRVWKQPREEALSAMLAGDETLILTSLRECRAIRMSDGELLWRTRIETPQGSGLAVDGSFLLAGAGGQVQIIDVATGDRVPDLLPEPRRTSVVLRAGGDAAAGLDFPVPTDPPQGNLTLYEDYVISCGPAGIAVYPRADVALAELQRSSDESSPARLLRIAELQLRLGRVADARRSLQLALEHDPDPPLRSAIELHLREVLYRAMSEDGDLAAVAALDRLARTPEERSRYLALRLGLELSGSDFDAALSTTAELQRLAVDHPVALDARERYLVEPVQLAAAALDRARAAGLAIAVSATLPAPELNRQSDVAEWRRLIPLCRTAGEQSALRRILAEELIDRGELQEAELILVSEICRDDAESAIAAAQLLAQLWESQGLAGEAAALQDEAIRRWNRTPTSGDAATVLPAAWTSSPMRPGASSAGIEELHCPDDCPHNLDSCNCRDWPALFHRNREFSRRPGATRSLFDRGLHGTSEKSSRLSIVDTAERTGLIDLHFKPRPWRAGDTSRHEAGHFLPLASGEVHGVSLLEGRLMWTTNAQWNTAGDRPILGPYGAEYCILQAGETILALDPLDGHVLWRRSDFEHDAGLVTDEVSGMFGDERALVVFNADHLHYRVLDPRSGELLRSGALELTKDDLRKRRWCFGRKLLYTTSVSGHARLVLWDPLTDRCDVDLLLERRLLIDGAAGRGIAAVLNGERLLIIDTESGIPLWEHQFEPKQLDGARMLRVVHDLQRFYIHFERDSTGSQLSPATGDLDLPNLQLGGLLCVVDRDTGEHWERTMPRCNLLWFPTERLPVLMTLARLRDGHQAQNVTLALEVIEVATGRTLTQRDDLHKTALVHAACDAKAGTIELSGIGARIVVRYGD